MIHVTRRLAVDINYANKWLSHKTIITTLFNEGDFYSNSLMFEDEDMRLFLDEFYHIDGIKYSELSLNSQGKKYLDGAVLFKTPYRVIFFIVGNRILCYGSKEALGEVKKFVNEYLMIKENDLGANSGPQIVKICKLSSKMKNETKQAENNQELNINEENEQSDNQTRTVSGFTEFVHNGKQSLNEDDDDNDKKMVKRRFIIKKKK